MSRLAAAALALGLALVPAASAGGSRVDLVVHAGTVWVVGDFGVRAYDARDGSQVYAPQPTAARYDLGVAIAGGAAFVASVENGYTHGAVTRIDLRTHETQVVWHRAHASAQYVAAGAGGVYVLLGATSGYSILRLTGAGRPDGIWPVVDAGRIAADASGCWVAADHRLLHIRTNGSIVEVLQSEGLQDVATGGGAAWFIEAGRLTRVDERTGVVRALRVGGVRPTGATSHELAVGGGLLWTATAGGVQARSLATGHVLRARALPLADAVRYADGAVWVATAADELYRLDPATLEVTLRVPLV